MPSNPPIPHALDDVIAEIASILAQGYQLHRVVSVPERGALPLTELVPLGGLRRVNLSDLRQSSGRCRIEDCPVYDGQVESGPLIKDRAFEFRDGVREDRLHTP